MNGVKKTSCPPMKIEAPTEENNSPPRTSAEKRYEEICTNIRATDEISFKLLGLVPLLSGAAIVTVSKNDVSQGLLWLVSIFGALITFGIFRWELRNIQTCKWLFSCAAEMERNEFGVTSGQFSGAKEGNKAPRLFGWRAGKTEAEWFIYVMTMLSWLALLCVK
ncbi:MAG: hypothetical protein H7X97_11520 [Opitutaceae bacterium]|nr:hypothetical protein [Verrucomicrobiales bacterium]